MTNYSIPQFEASLLAPTTPCHGTRNRHMIKEFDSTLMLPWQRSLGREVRFGTLIDNEAQHVSVTPWPIHANLYLVSV